MAEFSATAFFRQTTAGDDRVEPAFEYEETETGGSKRPTKAWWANYTKDKTVRRGRTMATRHISSHPRPELPQEQEDALDHPSHIEYTRRTLNLAKNPVPGTVVWRGEARSGDPAETARTSGVGMHWTVKPDAALIPHPAEGQRRVLWQGRIEHPEAQAISRSHPSWHGRNGYSMDHEAEVRFHPGSSVHVEGAYVWHGEGDPESRPVPRFPERTHPDWHWHPVGEHAQINNSGTIDYSHHGVGGEQTQESEAQAPPPWSGPDARRVLEHEHAAGNHYGNHPGGDLDDVDWDAPEHHYRAHGDAIMNDGVLANGWTQPHELTDHEASEWLRWHPDRAGIEQRHGGQHIASARTTVQHGDDIPSGLLNPHGHHITANVGGYTNVEMVPRAEIERYASQETSAEHAREVGHHVASTGSMEPLMLQYHPNTGEAYLGEGNHRLRAARVLKMDHVPVRVSRNVYGLDGTGVPTPQRHPAQESGGHVPADIRPSDLGIGTGQQHTAMAAAERPEWADGDFTAKTGHTYHTVTEPKAVTMRTPEGGMAGYINWGDDGVIGNMNVRDEHQRRGIATELLRRAREVRPDIQHSDRLSGDAQAWLKGIRERTASSDTPVPHNTDPYEHQHDWLPSEHFFAPGKQGLDPRLFDAEHGDHMHPEVRLHLLSLLHHFWAPKYGDTWQSWARVYLAGGAASHFWGDNDDLDVLIGVDFDAARHHVDAFTGEPDNVISNRLTDELKAGLNDEHRMLPMPGGGESGPWESTFFVLKPGPGGDPADIARIHPYAAYDLTGDVWAVRPVETGDDFSARSLPESSWDIVDAVRKLVKAIAELPAGVREREGAALYDYLHADRSAAFGPEGSGLWDPANVTWKALVAAPGGPLQQLIDWKHAHDAPARQEAAA